MSFKADLERKVQGKDPGEIAIKAGRERERGSEEEKRPVFGLEDVFSVFCLSVWTSWCVCSIDGPCVVSVDGSLRASPIHSFLVSKKNDRVVSLSLFTWRGSSTEIILSKCGLRSSQKEVPSI